MLRIKYFGAIAEATQCSEEEIILKHTRLSEVLEDLSCKYELEKFSIQIALNQNLVDVNDDILITDDDEIAILPPFAGG